MSGGRRAALARDGLWPLVAAFGGDAAAPYRALADARGWRYQRDAGRRVRLHRELALVQRCSDGVGLRHLCSGRSDGLTVQLFECRPTREDPARKVGSRSVVTVAALRDLPLVLPRFALLPATRRNRAWVAWQRFRGGVASVRRAHPDYLLVGPAGEPPRAFPGPRVRDWLDAFPGWSVEGRERELLLYRRRDRRLARHPEIPLELALGFWALLARERLAAAGRR